MVSFEADFYFLFNLLKSKTKFSFSKYADGEYAILRNNNITNCDDWTFNSVADKMYRDELLDSFKFDEEGYYVGISCPCCVPFDDVIWMRNNVGVTNDYLTWANIFVNGNYNKFVENFIPEFNNHEVILVATEKGNPDNLPFRVERYVKIAKTAWKDNFNLVEELSSEKLSNKLYLFCAGPLGNMLAAKSWQKNKNNIYMDIGSTLNPWLTGKNRGYLRGANTINKICVW